MRSRFLLLPLLFIGTIAISACGGSSAATDAVEAAPVDLDLTPYQIKNIQLDDNPEYADKIVEFEAYVIRTGSAAAGEEKYGDYYLYVECEKAPESKYPPSFSCYTTINYSEMAEKNVKVKGRVGANTPGVLIDCVVTPL